MIKYCNCGCGEVITSINPKTKEIRNYISGHNARGKPSYFRTEKWRKNRSIFMTENNPMKLLKNRIKQSNSQKGRTHSINVKQKISYSVKQSYDNIIGLRQLRREETIARLEKGMNSDTSIERKIENWLFFNNILYIKQYGYDLGVADFWLPETNTIVEADGDYWHSLTGAKEKDKKHNEWLENNDYTVIRLKEKDINNNFNYCIEKIQNAL